MTRDQKSTAKPNEANRFDRQDVMASVVVFLVALPLCMGIAIASGVPVAAGLITGIVGGIVVGMLAGSPFQVSGPAAGLTVIVYEAVQRFGLEMLGIAVLMAGALQLVAGTLRLGQWFRAVSPAVIKGMLAGIGVLIFASQFHVMIDDTPKGNGLQNLASIPAAIMKGIDVPQLETKTLRQFRADWLHQVGELHRRQVIIRERVGEHAPHDGERADISQAVDADPAVALATLAERQRELAAGIDAFLTELELVAGEANDSEELREAATEAKQICLNAAIALEAGGVAQAVATQATAVESLEGVLNRLKNHHLAAYLGMFTIVVIVLWQSFTPAALKIIPSPLVAVVLATVVATVLVLPVFYVEVPDNLADEIHYPNLSVLAHAPWPGLATTAILIAVVASAETLLCATAVDQMHQGARTKYDKELVAQGIGNICCGCLGALPMTGVIVRSSANVNAGAKSRWSAVLHGVWLLVFVVGLAFLLRMIPTASLAAMLVYTGYKLVDVKSVMKLWQYGTGEVMIYTMTVLMIVTTDLLTGVVTGIVLSAVKLLYKFSKLDSELDVDQTTGRAHLNLRGAATFMRLPQLAAVLEEVPRGVELRVDFDQLDYIDHACLDLMMNWAKQHESTGGSMVIDWERLHFRFHGDRTSVERGLERAVPGKERKAANTNP